MQKQYKSYTYIDTTSSCDLKPGKKYKLLCNTTELDHTLKPEVEYISYHSLYKKLIMNTLVILVKRDRS